MVVIYKETRDYTSNDVMMWYVVKFIKLRQQLPHPVPYVVETRTVSRVFVGSYPRIQAANNAQAPRNP